MSKIIRIIYIGLKLSLILCSYLHVDVFVWNIVLDFWIKLENLITLLGAKLILTEVAREDYGSQAGF